MTENNNLQPDTQTAQQPEIQARLFKADGQPRIVGVIGYPVEHSLSPALQNAAFDFYNLPHRYQKWAVAPNELRDFLDNIKREEFLGLNVTVPHKQAVLAALAETDEVVQLTGAANTLLADNGKLFGYNTDPAGFLEALKREVNFEPRGKRTMVLGAGGAARGVVLALASQGASEIAVANRTYDKAVDLVAQLAPVFPNSHIYATPLDPASWPFNRNPRALVVNATSQGLLEPDKEFPVSAAALSGRDPDRHTVFFDLTYGDTPFLKMVRPVAAHVLEGLSMLVYQGAQSFEFWTGLSAPVEQMLAAARAALAEREK